MTRIVLIILCLCAIVCCQRRTDSILDTGKPGDASSVDLAEIEESGELICVTLNGPDTYYEHRGQPTGLQYKMAELFANNNGLRLRVEIAEDSVRLVQLLKEGKADVVACELPLDYIEESGLVACGARHGGRSWSVNASAPHLADALDRWYTPEKRTLAQNCVSNQGKSRFKSHREYSAFYSKAQGVVSNYDVMFLRASQICGWDWKLLASQCYQESGFDPDAVSWAGARGLMQIMPSTARGMGVDADDLFLPETNLLTAARIIRQLEGKFSAIRNPNERKKFVLAAYNGGYGHVSDAQNLARKYGQNPLLWSDVSYYVLHLSEERFYKDPVVRCGYMTGRETCNYVDNVMSRWSGYHAVLHNAMPKSIQPAGSGGHKNNKFSSPQNIKSKNDSLFIIQK